MNAPECNIPTDDGVNCALLVYAKEAALAGMTWWPATLKDDPWLRICSEYIADRDGLDRTAVRELLYERMLAEYNANHPHNAR